MQHELGEVYIYTGKHFVHKFDCEGWISIGKVSNGILNNNNEALLSYPTILTMEKYTSHVFTFSGSLAACFCLNQLLKATETHEEKVERN